MLKLPTIDLRQCAPKTSFNNQKPDFRIFNWLVKAGLCSILSGFLILCQAQIFNAFEAHVINVTARICKYSETRTIGYWKTHPNVYAYYLPQYLGTEPIISIDDADEIFKKANARDMADMLKAQLLGMKFNMAHFGIGGYFVASQGMTLDEIVNAADELLISGGSRDELEKIKDLLDELNNLHQIRYCGPSDSEPESEPEPDPEPDDQCLKINEVYYDPDTNHGSSNDEWLELYNICLRKVNLQGWTLMDNSASQETISQDLVLESEQFAVLAAASSTLAYWPDIPDNALKISLGGTKLFNGLSNTGDHIVLYTPDDLEADAVSWGTDATAFNPAVDDVNKGHSIARTVKGQDTDTALDWQDLALPNPGTNPHSSLLGTAAQFSANLNAAFNDPAEESFEDLEVPAEQITEQELVPLSGSELGLDSRTGSQIENIGEAVQADELAGIDQISTEAMIDKTESAESNEPADAAVTNEASLDAKNTNSDTLINDQISELDFALGLDQSDLDQIGLNTEAAAETEPANIQEPKEPSDTIEFLEELPAPEPDNQILNASNIKPENSNEELLNTQEPSEEGFE